eukprot:4019876-Amphidinium_carterae.2
MDLSLHGVAVLSKLPSNRALDAKSRTSSQKRGFERMRVQRRVAQYFVRHAKAQYRVQQTWHVDPS